MSTPFPANFSRVASLYSTFEYLAFGWTLQRARTAHLELAREAKTILIIGEGDGRFLAALRKTNPTAQVTVLDASEQMLRLAQARTAHLGPTNYLHSDILDHTLSLATYDLIVTHFLLDCFDDEWAGVVTAKLARSAAPQATWLVADFALPPTGLAKWHAKAWLWTMYTFFRVSTGLETTALPDIENAVTRTGFTLVHNRPFRWGLIRSDVYERATSPNMEPS